MNTYETVQDCLTSRTACYGWGGCVDVGAETQFKNEEVEEGKETQNRKTPKLNTNLISIHGRRVIEKLFFDFVLERNLLARGMGT